MLLLGGSSTSGSDKPSLETSVEGRPRSCIHTAIGHDAADDDPLNGMLFQKVGKMAVDEGIVGVLADDGAAYGGFSDIGHQLPVDGAFCDGARRAPPLHDLVLEWRGEILSGVTVLGEETRKAVGLEVRVELEDIG